MNTIHTKEIFACGVGMCVGALSVFALLGGAETIRDTILGQSSHQHFDTHPIADPFDSEYHVHADFLIYINDTPLDLSDDRFMTTAQQMLSTSAHLHDNNGDVKHIHAQGVTFADFLQSIGVGLTETCLTDPIGTQYCADEQTILRLYVNGESQQNITSYIPVDNDRILLYYGADDQEKIAQYQAAVPNDSCYYSGTCPERGIAPSEECGLTCEL